MNEKFDRLCSIAVLLILFVACSPAEPPQHQHNGRYIKLSSSGDALPNDAESWACVFDKSTGLIWENKSNNEGLRHKDWTYTWSSQAFDQRRLKGTEGSCDKESLQHCTTEHYLAKLKQKVLCGADKWRLPSANELGSIVESSNPTWNTRVCSCLFSGTKAGLYWTHDFDYQTMKVNALNFANQEGSLQSEWVSPNNFLYLRAVAQSDEFTSSEEPLSQK